MERIISLALSDCSIDSSRKGSSLAQRLTDFRRLVPSPATINLRLAAVRRIAYEAADAGLLSPELRIQRYGIRGRNLRAKRITIPRPSSVTMHAYVLRHPVCS